MEINGRLKHLTIRKSVWKADLSSKNGHTSDFGSFLYRYFGNLYRIMNVDTKTPKKQDRIIIISKMPKDIRLEVL